MSRFGVKRQAKLERSKLPFLAICDGAVMGFPGGELPVAQGAMRGIAEAEIQMQTQVSSSSEPNASYSKAA